MNTKRINKENLFNVLSDWNVFLNKDVHLIACGGTAMTLLNVKSSTKDIDLLVPEHEEYNYLVKQLTSLGYEPGRGNSLISSEGFEFDLFPGKSVFTTELLEIPLKAGNNIPIRQWEHLYLGCLNYYDLIITKLFRGTQTDFRDVYLFWQSVFNDVDTEKFIKRYNEHARYETNWEKAERNLNEFLDTIKKEGYYEK